MKRIAVLLGAVLVGQSAFAQEQEVSVQEEELKQESKIKISGYTEVFYSYDFNQRADHIRQPFFYTFN